MLRDMIKSRNGLSVNGGVPTSSDHHDHVFQLDNGIYRVGEMTYGV